MRGFIAQRPLHIRVDASWVNQLKAVLSTAILINRIIFYCTAPSFHEVLFF